MGEKLSFSLRLLCISMFTLSCAIDIDVTDLTRASSTLNFENPEDFIYDANYVEITDNRISLKPLDLTDSGDDFSRGNHVGSSVSDSRVTLLFDKTDPQLTNENILPGLNNDLIGHWPFDNNYEDVAGISVPTIAGVPSFIASSQVGSGSIDLNGIDQKISYTNFKYDFHTSSEFTASVWIRTTKSGNNYIAGTNVNTGWYMRVDSSFSGKDSLLVKIDDGVNVVFGAGETRLNGGDWHHLVLVNRIGLLEGYVDGIKEISISNSGVGDLTDEVSIGSIAPFFASDFFEGTIDDFAIWKVALSADQIEQLYFFQSREFSSLSSSWTPKYNNIVGYWKMDGNWQDSSGNGSHLTASGGANFSSQSKVGSGAGDFDGVDDIAIATPSEAMEVDEVTFAAWVSISDNSIPVSIIGGYGNTGNLGFWLGHRDADGFRWFVGNGTAGHYIPSNIIASQNRWYHVVGSYDGNRQCLYVDGRLVAECRSVVVGKLVYSGLLDGFIVGNNENLNPNRFWNGQIDDVALWSTALSSSEVSKVYHRQKQKYGGHYNSEVIDFGGLTSNWPDLSWSTSLPFGKELVGDFDSDGTPDSESSSDYSFLTINLSDGLAGYWRFNETVSDSGPSGEDILDSSALGNHGNQTGVLNFGEKGILGQSIQSTETSNLLIPSSGALNLDPNIDYAISVWLKVPTDQSDLTISNNWIIEKWNVTPSYYPFSLRVYNSGDGLGRNGRLVFGKYDGTLIPKVVSPTRVNDNQWHHIFAQHASGQLELYIDGTLQGSVTDTTSNLPLSTGDLEIGDQNYNFNGYIDELLVFQKSFSLSDIKQLYRRGANRIKFQVRSCVDSSCNCKSFSTSPAGSVDDCDGDGVGNAADSDDIHQAEFMGPGGDGTTYFSELMNRKVEDIVFDCDANTSDSDDSTCNQDEILLTGSPKPTSPMFSFDDYLGSVKPQPNRYFQYRVNMEADENTACDGEPCLPELTSVSLAKDGESRYYGTTQVVESRYPIAYNDIESVSLEASTCVEFQLSPDKETYYFWNGKEWTPAASDENRSTASELESNITKYSDQFRKTNLYFKAFLSSDTTTPCDLGKIDLDYRELF